MTQRRLSRKSKGMPTQDGAGVSLSRIIGNPNLQRLDPFLMLDEFKSDDPDQYIAGFPFHPHRGFETVTYLLEGSLRHRDHMGNEGYLAPGSVQWMTAGKGIIHEEMPQQENGLLWGFQLWVNLPARDKMTNPRYQDIQPQDIPEQPFEAGWVRIIAGQYQEVAGPVQGIATEPQFLDVRFTQAGSWTHTLQPRHAGFVYVYQGQATLGDDVIEAGEVAILTDGEQLTLKAEAHCGLLVVAGQPLHEPVVQYGPFVMNTVEEVQQAITDYQSGRLTA
jgi:redox-sensitive bicupin YhaK (pirin superfamily)